MISVFVCEDNDDHRDAINRCIKNYITIEDLSMKLEISTASPTEIINYLERNKVAGLYFLDLDLNCETSGADLAEAIRKYDPRGFIVFVTSNTREHRTLLKRKVEMMDYIVKDSENMEEDIRACIKKACERGLRDYLTPLQNKVSFRLSDKVILSFKTTDILFFKTQRPHTILINYLDDDIYQVRTFRGSLVGIEDKLDGRFFRCSRECIVNIDKITSLDDKNYKLILVGDIKVDISSSRVEPLMKRLNLILDSNL
ncbi:MAG: LytTR family DNA-binding domain-containing protein [Defluviitaleaceae bacterium]|nr:LytTR family DNA-binding domain-containing protein [Defluviitaleaceae bacterium]